MTGRCRAPGHALQGLAALLAYLAVFLACYAFPLLRHPELPQVAQGEPDSNFFVWSMAWWPYALTHGLNPLFSAQISAPAGADLSWATTTPALAVVMWPVTLAFGPVTALNLTLLVSAPLAAWAAFLAARRLTGRFWAALAAGTVFGFSPYEVGHTGSGQSNLTFLMLLPLMVYLVLLWRDQKLGSAVFTILLAAAMTAEFYVFNEAFTEMTVLWAVALVIGFALARPADRRTIIRLARLAALAWLAAVVLASPYLAYMLAHTPASFVAATPANSLNLNIVVAFASTIPLLLTAAALLWLTRSSRLAWLLVVIFVLTVALAAGPVLVIGSRQYGPLPWGRLWSLPLARSAEPTRLSLFAYLVLAIIMALWLAAPARSRLLQAGRWALGAVAVALIIAHLPAASAGNVIPAGNPSAAARPPVALPAFISLGLYRRYLHQGEIVVVVSDRGNAGALFQAETDFYFRVAGGFINAAFSSPSGLPAPVEALTDPSRAAEQAFRGYVRRAGVGAVLVEQAWSAPWMRVFSQMGLPSTRAGGVIVYRTG